MSRGRRGGRGRGQRSLSDSPAGYANTDYGQFGSVVSGQTQYGAHPYPEMPQIDPNQPPLWEAGATGTAIFAGIITSEEYNPDLYWREAVRIYDVMRRSDYQINATLKLMELPLLGAERKITPASDDPEHVNQASLIETALFHELEQTFEEVLRQILVMIWAGFMVMEKTFKVKDDGTVLWQKFGPRLPRTIWRWWINEDNELEGIQQWTFKDFTYQYIDIPADKLMVFTYNQEGNNFEGISLLRTAYMPWFYKGNLFKIMGVGYEREHVGVPVIKLPPSHSAADLARAQKIGKNLRSNEQAFVTLPQGWEIEWLRAAGGEKKGSSILDAISLLDVAIARNMLGQFINLGSTETGSYALSSDQSGMFLMSLMALARYIADKFNQEAIPQLIRYNFKPDPMIYPKLEFSRLQSFDFESVAAAAAALAKAGLITPETGLEDYLRDMMGAPGAPHDLIEATYGAKHEAAIAGAKALAGGAGQEGDDDEGGKRSSGDAEGQGRDAESDAGKSSGTSKEAADIPDKFRPYFTAQHYLSMNPIQKRIYRRMVYEQAAGRAPYEVQLLNRREPAHLARKASAEDVKRQLKRSYRGLQSDLG